MQIDMMGPSTPPIQESVSRNGSSEGTQTAPR